MGNKFQIIGCFKLFIWLFALSGIFINSNAEQTTVVLANRTLINWPLAPSGADGGIVGMYERPKSHVYETLMYADLSSLFGATISNVTFRVIRGSYVGIGHNTPITLFVQDKGLYDPQATYDSYADTNWTTPLGTVTANWDDDSGTIYTISGPSLTSEVQSWVDNAANNQGLILSGKSNSDVIYMNFTISELVIDYTNPKRYKANNNNDLNLGSSWIGGATPQATDTVIWDNRVTGANTVNTGANLSWGGIEILDPGGSVYMSNNTITLGGGGINMSTATQNLIIASKLTTSADQVFSINAGKALIFNDTLLGISKITKTGMGTLLFDGDACDYSGSIEVTEGIMQVGAGNSSGCFGGNITNNSILIFNRNDDHAYVDTLSGTGSVTKMGSGMLYFTSPSTLTGDLTIDDGTLNMYIDSNPPNNGFYLANSITINSGATILTSKSNSLYGYGNTTGNVLTINKGGLLTTLDSITAQLKARLVMNGGELSSGDPHFYFGSWELDDDLTINGIDTSVISAVHCSWDDNTTRDFNISNSNGVLNVTGSFWANDTFAASFSKSGAGTMIISESSNMLGQITVKEGILNIREANALGTPDGKTTVENGASLELEGGFTCPDSLAISGTGVNNSGAIRNVNGSNIISGIIMIDSMASIDVDSGTLTINSSIVGSGALVKSGPGELILSGTNSLSGAIAINQGKLKVDGTMSSIIYVGVNSVLAGRGICGTINVSNDGFINPGSGTIGTLSSFNNVNLSNSSVLHFDLGLMSDTLKVQGNLVLDGILDIHESNGFAPGTYTLMTYGGTLTDNTLSIRSVPNSDYSYKIIAGGGSVKLEILSSVTVTIDADSVADYSNFDSLMLDIANDVINPDIVKFLGTNRDSFEFSVNVGNVGIDEIMFTSEVTDPDSFPVIFYNTTSPDFYMNTTVKWEGFVFTGPSYFDFNVNATGRDHSFSNCVFKDFTSPFVLYARLEDSASLTLTNCLFEKNSGTQGVIHGYMNDTGSSSITVINCTFDSNAVAVHASYAGNWDNYEFKNCIFSFNTSTFSSDSLKARTTYSVTTENPLPYGTGCIGPSIAGFVSNTRNVPSDWQLEGAAPAIGVGNIVDAPLFDISGTAHGATIAAGCWAGLENKLPTSQDKFIAIDEDSSYTFLSSDIIFLDDDVSDTLVKIQITELETVGALKLSGIDVILNQEISDSDIVNLTFTPDADSNGLGYSNFKFKVNDGSDYSSSSYLLTFNVTAVNDTPIVSSPITDMVVSEFISDSIYADLNDVFFDVEDGSSLAFTAVSQNSEIVTVSIDSSDSLILVGFSNIVSDTVKIFATATDLGGLKAQDTFLVILDRVNDTPVVVNPIPDVIMFEDNSDTTIADLNDVFLDTEDRSALTFSVMSFDSLLVVPIIDSTDSSLILALTGNNKSGNSAVIITATDIYGASISDTFSVIVVDKNDVPFVVDSVPDIIVDEDASDTVLAILTNVFQDEEDSSSLTFGVYSLDQNIVKGLILNDTVFSLRFIENAHGTTNVVISATDSYNSIGYDTIQVTVNSVNDAPVLHSITPWVMEEGYPVTLTLSQVYATDVDGDEMSIIIDTGTNYTVDSLTIYPKIGYVGNIIVSLSVTDGIDTSGTLAATIEVKYAGENRAPILNSAEIPPIEKNGSLRVNTDMLDAFDPDGDSLTIFMWEGDSYTIQGTLIIPDKGFTGVLEIPVKVTDGIALSSELIVEISVFEKVIDFYKGQIINSDTYEASVGPNPLPPESNELYFRAKYSKADELEITIYDELANIIHSGTVDENDGRFDYKWIIGSDRRYRSRAYLVMLTYYNDGIAILRKKMMVGVGR